MWDAFHITSGIGVGSFSAWQWINGLGLCGAQNALHFFKNPLLELLCTSAATVRQFWKVCFLMPTLLLSSPSSTPWLCMQIGPENNVGMSLLVSWSGWCVKVSEPDGCCATSSWGLRNSWTKTWGCLFSEEWNSHIVSLRKESCLLYTPSNFFKVLLDS